MSTVEVPGPVGAPVRVPVLGVAEPLREGGWPEVFARDGHAVLPGLIPPESIERLRSAIDSELRASRGLFWRQTTGRPEPHAADPHGRLAPPIQHLQDLRERDFPRFRPAALEVLTSTPLQAALTKVLGEPPMLVQSMLFEANPATPPHQDAYYLDSTREGEMVAAWVALEDIAPEAGRFYVCAGSHREELGRNAGELQGALHHDRYLRLVRDRVAEGRWELRAPALQAGDVLLWSSRTVHGSLPTLDDSLTRLSVTAHYIPASTGFLRMQSVVAALDLERLNGMDVNRQRPQERWRWRLMLQLAGRWPGLLDLARRGAARLRRR